MAKKKNEQKIEIKPIKQGMYEQVITDHITGKDRVDEKALQEEYDTWKKNQESIKALQEEYDTWKKAQTPTEEPKVEQPAENVVEAPKTEQPIENTTVVQKPAKKAVKAQKKPQEKVQKQAATTAPKQEKKTYLTHADIIPQLTKSSVDKQAKINEEKNTIGSGINQLDLSKYNLPESEDNISKSKAGKAMDKTRIKKQIEEENKLKKAAKQIQTDYVMTKEEEKEAKKTAKAELKQLKNKESLTEEDRAKQSIYKQLKDKTSAANAFGRNFIKLMARGGELMDYAGGALYEGLSMPVAKALDEITGTGYDRQAQVKANADAYRETIKRGADVLKKAEKNAKAQHPVASSAGEASGQMAAYFATSPVFDAAAKGLGVTSKVGQFVANQLGQAGQDALLDILPMYNEMMEDGVLTDEERTELLKRGGMDIGMNLAMPAVQSGLGKAEETAYESLAKNVGGGEDIFNQIDYTGAFRNVPDAARELNDVRRAADNAGVGHSADEIARFNSNPIEAENKQFSDLMNTFNSRFKDESAMKNIYTPEDVNASQNRQLAELMDEYRARQAVPEEIPNIKDAASATPSDFMIPENPKNIMGAQVLPSLNATNGVVPGANRAVNDIPNIQDAVKNYLGRSADDIASEAKAATSIPKEAYSLPDDVFAKIDSDLTEIAKPMNNVQKSGIMDAVTDEKALTEWQKLNDAYSDYATKAMFSESVEEVETAKKTLDAARKRYARAMKEIDPEVSKAFNSGDLGNKIGRPLYERNTFNKNQVMSQEAADAINELENSTKAKKSWVDDLEPVPREYVDTTGKRPYAINQGRKRSGKKVKGANPMQFFADGSNKDMGEWKTSALRTNTLERTGKIVNPDDIPEKDFAYRVFKEVEQKAQAENRYKGSKNVAKDLMNLDRFDEVDIKAAMDEWLKLMDKGDDISIRRAKALSLKLDGETREGGRIIQAVAEYTRDTPEGQVRAARRAISDAVDKKVGTGTSEALDNIAQKIYKAFEDYGNDKEALKKKISEILDGDLKKYVNGKTAKKMGDKDIKGKNKILKMIEKGKAEEKIIEQVYKDNGGVSLTSQEEKKVYDLLVEAQKLTDGSYEQEEKLARAARIAVAKAPSSFGTKFRSILYSNMLGNFKTALSRNAYGNAVYQTLEQGRQPIAALVDRGVSKITGKRSTLGWNKEKSKAYVEGLKKGTSEQLKDIAKHIDTGRSGAKGWKMALANNATTYNDTKLAGKLANGVEYYVRNAMELGDRPFFEANYNQRYKELQQLVARYGKDNVAGLAGFAEEDIPEAMDMIASVHAADSVFQKHGKMSKGLTDIRNGLGEMSEGYIGVDILSTAASPFTMTPGNIMERAVEYTPLGFVKNAAETLGEVYGKKSFNQKRFVDEASRSIAGLPILAGTVAMAKKGMINGGYSDDPDERKAQQEDGYIPYGFNIPKEVPFYGGMTLDTSDWPVIGPGMQAGAVVAEEGITPKSLMQATEAVGGSATMQGLNRAFGGDSQGYNSSSTLAENFRNTLFSSGSQLVPSLARQTAQTIDPYKRELGEFGTKEYYFNLLKNSDPVGRFSLPIKTNVEGEPVLQNQGRPLPAKIFENYLAPMNISEYKPSELNKEASRLLETTGEARAFVQMAKRDNLKKFDEAAGKTYSEKQFQEYKKDLGKLSSELGNALIDSKEYKKLTDEQKVNALNDAYSAMKQIARYHATGMMGNDKLAEAYKNAGGGKKGTKAAVNYIIGRDIAKDAGISTNSNAYKDVQEAAKNGDFKEARQIAEDEAKYQETLKSLGIKGSTATRKAYNEGGVEALKNFGELKSEGLSTSATKVYESAKKEGITIPDIKTFSANYKKIDNYGNNNGSVDQKEFKAFLNDGNYTQEEAERLASIYGNWTKKPKKNSKGQWVFSK